MVNESERHGCANFCRSPEMRDFANFIMDTNLTNVQCKGKAFSWFGGDGKSTRRIDRLLLSDSLIAYWGIVGQLTNKRDIYDHFPI